MAYVITGLFVSLVAGWVYSEYRPAITSTRVTLGGTAILMLCLSIYANEVGNFYRDAHNAAAIRLLGEALDDGDVEAARNAIRVFNSHDPAPSGYVIVEILADRKRPAEQPVEVSKVWKSMLFAAFGHFDSRMEPRIARIFTNCALSDARKFVSIRAIRGKSNAQSMPSPSN